MTTPKRPQATGTLEDGTPVYSGPELQAWRMVNRVSQTALAGYLRLGKRQLINREESPQVKAKYAGEMLGAITTLKAVHDRMVEQGLLRYDDEGNFVGEPER